ncbi:MFS transporter [Granulicella sp. S190]|uniref:MFS transporter n=1 Tax=Granulicella sp. S190 TaxID=1747226 RepID=UPI00131D78BA|nr:MFS transporter [Granulicella sp. S190]
MTSADATSATSPPASSPAPTPAVMTVHPLLGVAGVLLGAMIATGTGRLISVGLADMRGALHLGVDEAAWIGTAFNAPMMFIGPFSVYLGGLLGARRVLLTCASLFCLISLLLPLVSNLTAIFILLGLAGVTAGTFYPLTLSFVLRGLPMKYVLLGIAMYAIDIVFTTNVSTSLEAWYMDHLSWRWIFWTGAALAPVMVFLIYFGVPWQPLPKPKEGQPKPNWRGFLYASLGFAFLYTALDQGQRLDWLHSGTIVALSLTGLFLLLAALERHFLLPNPLIAFRFLLRRNTLLLSLVLVLFRFSMLATVVTIPNYLAAVQGYRALQTGPVLLWVALPQILLSLFAMSLVRRIDPRLILTFGFTLITIACLINARLSSEWSGSSFAVTQLVLAVGLALAFNAMVGSLVLELINTGALTRPVDTLTFAGFFQTVRLFGGQIGTVFMLHFISIREQFHSNILGLGVHLGQPATSQRLLGLRAAMASHTTDMSVASGRAGQILGMQLHEQAFTLAIADSFTLVACAAVFCLIVIACMERVPTQYRQVVAAPAGAA